MPRICTGNGVIWTFRNFIITCPSRRSRKSRSPIARRRGCWCSYRAEQRWEDRMFRDFPQFLHAGDCLVLNDSKVFPSRLFGKRVGFSGVVEVLLVQPISEDAKTWTALVHPGRKMRTRERVVF